MTEQQLLDEIALLDRGIAHCIANQKNPEDRNGALMGEMDHLVERATLERELEALRGGDR